MRDDIVDVEPNKRAESLKTVSWISYFLHLIVAVGAVVPGAQPSLVLLFVALALDLVKRSDARGTWQSRQTRVQRRAQKAHRRGNRRKECP